MNVARGLTPYMNMNRVVFQPKDIRLQMLELAGRQPFDQGLYHCQAFEHLIKSLQNQEQTNKKESFTQQYNLWSSYITTRKEQLPQEFQMSAPMISNLEEAFSHHLLRNQKELQSDRIAAVHRDYATSFKFQIPIEPRCLVQMIHPHFGYLTRFPSISFPLLINLYETKLVASYEKELGQDLLANSIVAHAYWTYFDQHHHGHKSLQEFIEFIKVFRFNVQPSEQAFKNEFNFALKQVPNGVTGEQDGEEMRVSWEFFRYLFLERNL